MCKIVLLGLLGVLALPRTLPAQTALEIRDAIGRALPALENSASTFVARRACVSCHHNTLTVLAFRLAREKGFAIDPAVLAAVEDKTFHSLHGAAALDDAIQTATLEDPTPNDSLLLMAANAAGLPQDLTTEVYARRLVSWQRDGHWVTSDFRPPHSSSRFTATATAVRAISFYMPEELRVERDRSLLQARRWLAAATRLESTEDASFRLMGLIWAGGSSAEIAAARQDLLALRTPAGAWPELPGYPADAYSTGEALYALHEGGMAINDRGWSAAAGFLLTNQAADGTWRVQTRMISPAEVSPAYFATGFPYGKDEYLSYAGSSWAVLGLLTGLPATEKTLEHGRESETETAPWIRTALFGSAQQLETLLDGGLSPNSKTTRGTTLLMMAVPDAEKVRLLIKRGADVKARTESGCDAVTIAAAFRGSAAAVRMLLDAGAEANTPKGVPVRHGPLEFASMSGDLENVKLLLAHGAQPSTGLSQAVTFGYPDVVRALLAAGASAKVTEGSGINLLHWAAIADRPEVVPMLVEAGAAINAVDRAGYTPLMYAATIDFGDVRVVKALLKAGADPHIRNSEGRTAFEQARYYQHSLLQTALQLTNMR